MNGFSMNRVAENGKLKTGRQSEILYLYYFLSHVRLTYRLVTGLENYSSLSGTNVLE